MRKRAQRQRTLVDGDSQRRTRALYLEILKGLGECWEPPKKLSHLWLPAERVKGLLGWTGFLCLASQIGLKELDLEVVVC